MEVTIELSRARLSPTQCGPLHERMRNRLPRLFSGSKNWADALFVEPVPAKRQGDRGLMPTTRVVASQVSVSSVPHHGHVFSQWSAAHLGRMAMTHSPSETGARILKGGEHGLEAG